MPLVTDAANWLTGGPTMPSMNAAIEALTKETAVTFVVFRLSKVR
jgi:fatty acid-binding protein DegV